MSLRARLLALFLLLAAVPMLALGAVEYARSLRALEALIAAQNARVAQRVASAIVNRTTLLQSDLALLAENAETQRWLAGVAAGADDAAAAREADRFVRDAWDRMGSAYAELHYLDERRRIIYEIGSRSATPQASLQPAVLPIRDLTTGKPLGTVSLTPAVAALVPLDLLASGFGETGLGMVLDRGEGRVISSPDASLVGTAYGPLMASGTWQLNSTVLDRPSGMFRYRSGDTLRVASFVSLTSPPWTVVMSGAVNEFAAPFLAVRGWTVALFLTVALIATLVFSQLLRRTTRSLEDLTAATAVVGRGDFAPALPPAGADEVGRLTGSFETMVTRIRDMVQQIETSRQMAVLGEFAAQLSHEIRNPLTSIKLNLQTLERDQRSGRLPASADRPVEIALREVARLDTVVRGVLDLARARPPEAVLTSLHGIVEEAAEALAAQAERDHVKIVCELRAPNDAVCVDSVQVKGALLNLMLNALEAMPGGGTLTLASESADGRVRLAITDTGEGIAPERRTEVFRPFVSSRAGGTGLGLPLAKRAVEDNGGTLTLSHREPGTGAEFVLEFPASSQA